MFRFVSRDRFPFCVSAATGLFSFSVGLVNAFYVFFFLSFYISASVVLSTGVRFLCMWIQCG